MDSNVNKYSSDKKTENTYIRKYTYIFLKDSDTLNSFFDFLNVFAHKRDIKSFFIFKLLLFLQSDFVCGMNLLTDTLIYKNKYYGKFSRYWIDRIGGYG